MRQSSRLAVISGIVALVCAAAASAFAEPDEAAAPRAKGVSGLYLVRMSDDPVLAYRGGIPGLKATRPAPGRKIDPLDPAVVNYVRYLDGKHDAALAAAGGGRKVYGYRYALNGFAARIAPDQAAALAKQPGVVAVEPDFAEPVDTITTPRFLGLTASGGLWSQLGGPERAGEDIVIGVIDTGVWPEHPSFSDRMGTSPTGVDGKLEYRQLPGWHGRCVPGEQLNASHCNQKLIGCQHFVEGFGTANLDPTEYVSCRDSDSHGTHTASTAGGNHGVMASVEQHTLGPVSGIAPRARIAAYKTCWRAPGELASCFASDRVAAIDQAVADGVDVLNHSIGATQTNFLDPVQVAFLFAADAGIFVAASGGNSGPGVASVASPGPWLTTVAASTHDRLFAGEVTLGSGDVFAGASLTADTALLPLVYAGDAGVAVDPTPADTVAFATRVALCFPGHLDAAKAGGKIVLCDRGINARVDKSLAVKQANGAGMILRNLPPTVGINADLHHVPSVHVESAAGIAIKAFMDAQGAAAAARLDGNIPGTVAAPFIASFSSRGPIRAAGGDILKPDLTAPGVDVLAGVSPAGDGGRLFDFFQGTSMSSPHVAGLGALLKQRHPDWSPIRIKSALMTTASPVLGSGAGITPFAQGAGHVNVNRAVDPGLVYDHAFDDWVRFICGTGQLTGCATSIDPSDLNQASIAIGDVLVTQAVTRRVRNIGPAGTYTASVVAPAGFSVVVDPPSMTLGSGDLGTFTLTFTRTTAPFAGFPNGFQFGSLTWSDGAGHSVRSPIAVRPLAIAGVPALLARTTPAGSASFDVRFGYTGTLVAAARGLVPPVTTAAAVADDPGNAFDVDNPNASPGTTKHLFTIPSGTGLARISLFDAFTDGADDLDLYVYNPAGVLIAASLGATANEQVNLNNPAAGTYSVYVHGFQTDGPNANYTLFTWSVGGSAGNMTVTAPGAVTALGTGTITVNWAGLAAATKYLGLVTLHNPTLEIGRTVVQIDTP